jgi:NAD(P)-dependent dehydrogenase (short-subunit alcohol dehydrogenase family)
MIKKRSGKIINVGSAAAILAIPQALPYVVAKHAIVGLTRALAVDLGPYNINVNCICPGPVQTPLLDQATTASFRAEITKTIPLNRLGKPSDLANAAVFLASSLSDWITGVVLPVDGGLVCCVRARHWE